MIIAAVPSRRVRLAMVGAAVLGFSACASTPPEKDPVQIRMNDIDTRLAQIERTMTNQSLLQLANEIEALRADVRGMHDELDKTGNDVELSRKRQRDLYADLDQRLKAVEGHSSAPTVATARSAAPAAIDGNDRSNYQAAFALLKDSQYDAAIAAFSRFLVDFPDSALADNAQYWLGEAYYVNRDFPASLSAFQRVIDRYPQSSKVPDALLKAGYCEYEMKHWDRARAALAEVAAKYPSAPSGRLAQQRLEKLQAENH